MTKRKTSIVAIFVVIILLILLQTGCNSSKTALQEIHEQTADVLLGNGTPVVGSLGGEWVVIGLSRSGKLTDDAAKGYLENAEAYVKDIGSERLHRVKSTDNSRMILGITAAGGDPTNIGGYDLTAGLSDMEYIKGQGNNGPIWALIALDSKQYEIPKAKNPKNQTTREKLVAYILSAQNSDGGWGLTDDRSDIDMTAMALQSLSPYQGQKDVNTAIQKSLDYLSERQLESGGFESYGSTNSESCAQVIVALTALQIDPLADSRFIKNGKSVLDALCAFSVEGGFSHLLQMPKADPMATEQAYYALTAYFRFNDGETALYDMVNTRLHN